MLFLCRLMEHKGFYYANCFNWSLTSPVILDTRACRCWTKLITQFDRNRSLQAKCSAHCFSLNFGSECLQRRKNELVCLCPRLQDERRRQNRFAKSGLRNLQRARSGSFFFFDQEKWLKDDKAWKTHWNYRERSDKFLAREQESERRSHERSRAI